MVLDDLEWPFGPWRHSVHCAGTLVLFLVGSLGALLILPWTFGWHVFALAGAALTGLYAAARTRPRSRALRIARWLALVLLLVVHAFWIYEATTFGLLLSWAVPRGLVLLVLLLLLATVVTARRSWRRPQVPVALSLGLWIAACLGGWARAEWSVRCDDYQRAVRQPGVRLLVASVAGLERCERGESVAVDYYPRRLWEDPSGSRLVFTSQTPSHDFFRRPAPRARLRGAICEAPVDGSAEPHCVRLPGKAHAIVDAPALDRLFVGVMRGLGPQRSPGVVALPRRGPLAVTARVTLSEAASMYYDAAHDLLGVSGDRGREILQLRASDLTPAASPPAMEPVAPPDVILYDAGRGEGVLCSSGGLLRTLGGHAYLAAAFRSIPLSVRALAPSSSSPSSWLALTWGCAWDPAARRVFSPVSTLGQLAVIDYDSGAVLERHFVGFGIRVVALDRARQRVYLGDFLRGNVLAFDRRTFAEVGRWFVGRYVRDLEMTRDGTGLLASSNLGVVRIALEP